jgi:hypothetical protein
MRHRYTIAQKSPRYRKAINLLRRRLPITFGAESVSRRFNIATQSLRNRRAITLISP